MDTKRQLSEKIFHLKRLYNNLINISEEASEQLMEIADELDKHANNVNEAKVGGAAGAVAGGAMCAVGFGLSFVTFGASLGLVIAGTAVGLAGGVTGVGAEIAKSVLTRDLHKKADRISQDYNDTVKELAETLEDLRHFIERVTGNNRQNWNVLEEVLFAGNVSWESIKGAVKIGKSIYTFVTTGLKLVGNVYDDIARGCARTAFATAGTAAARGFHIAGGVVGMVFMPVDIYFMIKHSIAVHKEHPHEMSDGLRAAARRMRESFEDTQETISHMIDEWSRM